MNVSNYRRRDFINASVMSLTATQFAISGTAIAAVSPDARIIRPFKIHVSDGVLVDLRKRIAATRYPDRETVSNRTQGVQLAKFRELHAVLGYGL